MKESSQFWILEHGSFMYGSIFVEFFGTYWDALERATDLADEHYNDFSYEDFDVPEDRPEEFEEAVWDDILWEVHVWTEEMKGWCK